jgi:hypothetical protein
MPSLRSLTPFPMLLLLLLGAPGCAKPASALQTYPPAELLGAELKPVPSIDILTSAQASAKHNIAIETWGQKGWDRVKAVCVWAKERGMTEAPC